MIETFFDICPELLELDKKAMELCKPEFEKIHAIQEYNQVKMLKAFTECGVSSTHLMGQIRPSVCHCDGRRGCFVPQSFFVGNPCFDCSSIWIVENGRYPPCCYWPTL